MNIVVFGLDYFNYSQSIVYALERLGHKVQYIIVPSYNNQNKETTIKEFMGGLSKRIISLQPDFFISISSNYYYEYIQEEFLNELKRHNIKLVSWFLSSIRKTIHINQHLDVYDYICTCEEDDVEWLKKELGLNCIYVPDSVDERIYCNSKDNYEKEFDICFAGVKTDNRVYLLDKVAEYCAKNGKSMIVYGEYYSEKHWWKRYLFALKHPYLCKFLKNTIIDPNELSIIYMKSYICLNIHIPIHKNSNNRTFEILGNGNFELSDRRYDCEKFGLKDGKNIVYYDNEIDLVDKIDYYLNNKHLIKEIGLKGRGVVENGLTMRSIVKKYVGHIFR